MFFLDSRTVRVVWTVLAIVGGLALAYAMRLPLLLLVFSVFFAYLVYPLVQLFERWMPRRGRRALAIGVVYLLLIGALVGLGLGVGPSLSEEGAKLWSNAPQITEKIASGRILTDMLLRRGWSPERVQEAGKAFREHAGQMTGSVQSAITVGLAWLSGAWVVVLVPVFAFFILKDADQASAAVDKLIEDPSHRTLWHDIAEDVHVLLGRYVRALILLSLITFVVWWVVFLVADVPYGAALAAIGGVLELLPIVGPLTAGGVLLSVAAFSGYGHFWLLLAFVLLWRGIQDYVSSPLVMGRGIELHPAVVIFGVIAGGEIGGPVAMFLSVPVIAALRVVWRHVHRARHPPAA